VIAVWLCGLVALTLFAGLAWYLAPLQPGVVALQLAFTPQAFGRVVHAWPPQHLQRYLAHLPVDGLLLASYGAFGYLLVTRSRLFASGPDSLRRVARWLLPAAALFDAAENTLQAWLASAPRFGVPWAYALSATCSSLKWLLLLVFAALVVKALGRGELGADATAR
jgi:hypothetical protein